MQFLVYVTVLMAAISTVLLEVHWLTSPAPQPKPTIQASAPPPPKPEGPNEALSPIYPKKVEPSRTAESGNSQAQNAPPPAQAAQQSAPPSQSPPAQHPASAQTTGSTPAAQPAAPSQQARTAASPQPSDANAGSQQKPSRETTGAAAREENSRQAFADPTKAANPADNSQQTAQGSSTNRCDIQACASTYRSFRTSDCTYQPFDGGSRRLCEKSPGQRMAREREQPERRRWDRDAEARYVDRPGSGRRLVDEDDDVAADFDDARREPLGFFLFGRRSRW